MSEAGPPLEYGDNGPSIEAFLEDEHFIRALIGGRGSGKTRGLAEDITRHCWRNAGAKAIVARETEVSQADSSIDTFWEFFESLTDDAEDAEGFANAWAPGLGLFKAWNNGRSFRVPSQLAIDRMRIECREMTNRAEMVKWVQTRGHHLCSRIEFRGLPDADKGKFRGMECSYLALVEADQITKKQFALSLACLRWKGADPRMCDAKGFIVDRCVVLDSNPPSESHWIAEMEAAEKAKPEHERVMRFWHLSTYENEHNLPPDYIQNTILLPYENNPPMIERMLYGRYADAFDGKPVYYGYRRGNHEATKLGFPMGATLVVGMDVGTNNASVISAFKEYKKRLHWWTLREIELAGSDTDRQCIELLKVLGSEFPFWNQEEGPCAQTLFFCDPAAKNSSYTKAGPTSSALAVLHSHGIFPGMKTGAHIQPTIATVNRLFLTRYVDEPKPGEQKTTWAFKIDPEKCPRLARALRGMYRYPTRDEVGYGNDLPLKGTLCDDIDHVADAFRYSVINALDLAMEMHTPAETQREQKLTAAELEPSRTI